MRILIYSLYPLIHIPWTNFFLQIVLWLRGLAARVQTDLASLLPPLPPCYISGFQSVWGLLSQIFVVDVCFLYGSSFSAGMSGFLGVCVCLFFVMSALYSFIEFSTPFAAHRFL